MEVKHDASRQEFYVELEGHRATWLIRFMTKDWIFGIRLCRKPLEEKVLLLLW